jgi:adenylate kinase family enzyme
LAVRINITGNAGSGKSSLAKRLGAELGLPVYSLDSIVWQAGWVKTMPEQRAAAEEELVTLPRWIIDGVSATVRARSDLVVFLDVPRHVCAWRGVARACRYFKQTRPELPAACPDIHILPYLLRLIYRFPSGAGAQIRHEAQLDPRRFRIERHPLQVGALVNSLAPANLRSPANPTRASGQLS